MTLRYIDAHCHLQFPDYADDRDVVIARMAEEGVAGVVVGCDLASSEAAVLLTEKYEHLYAAVGQHPNHVEDWDAVRFEELAHRDRVVAIGECGLDYFRPEVLNAEVKHAQQELFRKHITLAAAFDKPLILHVRPSKGTVDAYHDVIEMLRDAKQEHPHVRGDVHFFVGGSSEADAFRALGFTVSYTAVITFAREYDEVIRHIPLESILVETDAPYVAPASRRGTRNDSLAVPEIVRRIAEVRGEENALVERQLLENASRLFGIKC